MRHDIETENSITQSNNSEPNLYNVSDDDMDEELFSKQNRSQNIDVEDEESEIEKYFIKEKITHWSIRIKTLIY